MVVKPAKLPGEVVAALAEPVVVGSRAQAFPLLTVDDTGAPHCCLLSSTEVSVTPDATELHVALASRRTRGHLVRRPHAGLLVVEGTTLHTCKLAVAAMTALEDDVVGVALRLVSHEADSLGIALSPLGFVPPPDIAEIERWDRTATALAAMRRSRTGR